jgi:hypothetical protein
MSSSRRSVDDDGNDNDNDNDDGTKKCTRCIRGPSYKHGHDITCPRSKKYVQQTANNTKNVPTKTTNNTKSPELDPELEEINRRAKAILTKAINTKSPELVPELEVQQQRKRKKVTTTNTTKIRTKTKTTTTRLRVDDGTKECTRCVRGPKYKHGHDITCPRSQNYRR